MRANDYIPDEGDIVWLNFTPQSGFEQAGRRPAVVLSPRSYNGRTGLMLCVPATTQVKGYPFEVALDDARVTGVALSDQIKSLDWESRDAEFKGKVSAQVLAQIKTKLKALLRL